MLSREEAAAETEAAIAKIKAYEAGAPAREIQQALATIEAKIRVAARCSAWGTHCTCARQVSGAVRDALVQAGYHVSIEGPTRYRDETVWLVISWAPA